MNADRGERTEDSAAIHILLVEDERFVREVAAEILQSAGYCVLKARTAREAVRAFHRSQEKIDLLITGIVLPGKNGSGLSEELEAESPGIRTIFMSGYPEKVTHLNGGSTNSFCLAKPFSVESLMKKVQQALGASTALLVVSSL